MNIIKTICCLVIALAVTSFTKEQSSNPETADAAEGVLKKTSEKLDSLKEVSYSYFRSIRYFSEDYHAEVNGETFVTFDNPDKLLGFKFQLDSKDSKIIYNGNEYFVMNKKDKTITVKNHPNPNDFENLWFFLNSLVTLKKSLPTIISDRGIQKKLSDTTINSKNYHLVSFVLENKTLSGFGKFLPITLKRNFLYKVVIDKDSFLPSQIIQTNSVEPKDYMLTSFNNMKMVDNAPSELSWYYSTYNEYKQKTDKRLTIIEEKSVAPAFKLPYYDSNDMVYSMQLKSKFTLLEFWMKNCGYCIQAVPKLNNISHRYNSSILEIIGINGTDSKDQIKSFYERNKPLFRTLYDENGKISKDFGVDAFPQVVLLDKKRNVLYSGNLDIEKIEKLLSSK